MTDPNETTYGGTGLSSSSGLGDGPLAEGNEETAFEQEGYEEQDGHETSFYEDDDLDTEEETTDFDQEDVMEDLRRDAARRRSEGADATASYPQAHAQEAHGPAGASARPLDKIIAFFSRFWWLAVAFLIVVLVAFFGYRVLYGGSGSEASTEPQQTQAAAQPESPAQGESPPTQGTPAAEGANAPVKETGIVLEERKDGEAYFVSAGEIDGKPFAWGGKVENTEEGEVTTLEGPTAFKSVRSVKFPGGYEDTAAFGRDAPGQPILYASYIANTIGGETHTNGIYHVFEQDELVLVGNFEDTVVVDNPEDEPDEIERVYEEGAPGSAEKKVFKVTFEAKSDAPKPALIGWTPPSGPAGETE